jgi:NADH dehydrogenase FAD-containing subunit
MHTNIYTLTQTQITLVDQSDRFVFKPLLYELLNGGADETEVAPTFLQLLAPYPVRYIQVCVCVYVGV